MLAFVGCLFLLNISISNAYPQDQNAREEIVHIFVVEDKMTLNYVCETYGLKPKNKFTYSKEQPDRLLLAGAFYPIEIAVHTIELTEERGGDATLFFSKEPVEKITLKNKGEAFVWCTMLSETIPSLSSLNDNK